MAKIEFSPGMMSGLPQRILSKNQITGNLNNSGFPSDFGLIMAGSTNAYGNNCVFLELHSGVRLTKTQLEASRTLTAGQPYPLARLNTRLLSFTNGTLTGSSGDFSPSVVGNPSSISTIYKAAQAAGSATWFCLAHGIGNGYTTFGNFITGDVGVTGSGADLEISDVNIVAGELYRVSGFKINFPSFWEY